MIKMVQIDLKDYLSVEDFASKLGLGVQAIYIAIRRSKIPASKVVKVGRTVLIHKDELANYKKR